MGIGENKLKSLALRGSDISCLMLLRKWGRGVGGLQVVGGGRSELICILSSVGD